jgi:hypothetical protein
VAQLSADQLASSIASDFEDSLTRLTTAVKVLLATPMGTGVLIQNVSTGSHAVLRYFVTYLIVGSGLTAM